MAKIQYKNIYFFRYNNPSSKPNMWDKAPLVIPLDVTRKSMLAINLHWIPLRQRREFVDWLIKNFRTDKRLKRLFYAQLKSKFPGALWGVRRYHVSRITSLIEIPQKNWDGILAVRKYKTRRALQSKIDGKRNNAAVAAARARRR